MPIIILFAAVFLVAAGINNKIPQLFGLLKEDFQPSDGVASFGIWMLAIFFIGVIGYYSKARPFSNAFLVLLFLAIFLAHRSGGTAQGSGFFDNLTKAFKGNS